MPAIPGVNIATKSMPRGLCIAGHHSPETVGVAFHHLMTVAARRRVLL